MPAAPAKPSAVDRKRLTLESWQVVVGAAGVIITLLLYLHKKGEGEEQPATEQPLPLPEAPAIPVAGGSGGGTVSTYIPGEQVNKAGGKTEPKAGEETKTEPEPIPAKNPEPKAGSCPPGYQLDPIAQKCTPIATGGEKAKQEGNCPPGSTYDPIAGKCSPVGEEPPAGHKKHPKPEQPHDPLQGEGPANEPHHKRTRPEPKTSTGEQTGAHHKRPRVPA